MGAVDLHAVEAGLLGDGCRGGEAADDVLDLIGRELTRSLGAGHLERDGTRRDRLGAAEGIGLTARVVDLHPDRDAAVLGGLGPAPELVEVAIVLDRDIAGLAEMAPVDHDVAGHDESVAAFAPCHEEAFELLGRRVGGIAERLAEGRLHEAVGQDLAAGKRQRFVEERRHFEIPSVSETPTTVDDQS